MRKYRQSAFPDQLPALTDLGTVEDQGFKLCLSVVANVYAMLQVLGAFIKPETKKTKSRSSNLYETQINCSDNIDTPILVKESGLV